MRIVGYSSLEKVLLASPGPCTVDVSSEIALELTGRGCAGRWEGESHICCESLVAPYCPACEAAVDPCVICRGDCRKPVKTCSQEHSVYLAVFAPSTVKVGVSRAYRLETRLAEQGADEGYEIARFPDGEAARRLERSLSERFPDRLGFAEKIRQGCVDRAAISAILSDFTTQRQYAFKRFPEFLHVAPIILKPRVGMTISGKVYGIKGQALVLEKYDTLYALSLDSLIGYDFEAPDNLKKKDRKERLQVSLAGF